MGSFWDSSSEEKENQNELIQQNIQNFQPASGHDITLYALVAFLFLFILSVLIGIWCVINRQRHSRLRKQITNIEARIAKL